jgi:hypothetical protein
MLFMLSVRIKSFALNVIMLNAVASFVSAATIHGIILTIQFFNELLNENTIQ